MVPTATAAMLLYFIKITRLLVRLWSLARQSEPGGAAPGSRASSPQPASAAPTSDSPASEPPPDAAPGSDAPPPGRPTRSRYPDPPPGAAPLTSWRDFTRWGGATDPRLRDWIDRQRESGTWVYDRDSLHVMIQVAVWDAMTAWGFEPVPEIDEAGTRHPSVYTARPGRRYTDFIPTMHPPVNQGFAFVLHPVFRNIPAVEQVWDDLKPLVEVHRDRWMPTISVSVERCFPGIVNEPDHNGAEGLRVIGTPEGMAEYARRFSELYRDYLATALERYRDLRVVADEALADFRFSIPARALLGSQGETFRRLIVARLAGDPRYEALYDYEMSHEAEYLAMKATHPHRANYPRVLREIHQRLAAIPPLDNPILD